MRKFVTKQGAVDLSDPRKLNPKPALGEKTEDASDLHRRIPRGSEIDSSWDTCKWWQLGEGWWGGRGEKCLEKPLEAQTLFPIPCSWARPLQPCLPLPPNPTLREDERKRGESFLGQRSPKEAGFHKPVRPQQREATNTLMPGSYRQGFLFPWSGALGFLRLPMGSV